MKKIECQISDTNMELVNQICNENGYTYAEFNRRAIEDLLEKLGKVPWHNAGKFIGANKGLADEWLLLFSNGAEVSVTPELIDYINKNSK